MILGNFNFPHISWDKEQLTQLVALIAKFINTVQIILCFSISKDPLTVVYRIARGHMIEVFKIALTEDGTVL